MQWPFNTTFQCWCNEKVLFSEISRIFHYITILYRACILVVSYFREMLQLTKNIPIEVNKYLYLCSDAVENNSAHDVHCPAQCKLFWLVALNHSTNRNWMETFILRHFFLVWIRWNSMLLDYLPDWLDLKFNCFFMCVCVLRSALLKKIFSIS